MNTVPKTSTIRLYGIIVSAALGCIVLVFLSARPGIVPHPWIKVAATASILEMILLGWWARKRHRLSVSLLLLVVGGALCFVTIFLPVGEDSKTTLLNLGASFLVLSFLTRVLKLLGLVAKRH